MNKKQIMRRLLFGTLILGTVILSVINLLNGKGEFWTVSCIDVLSILVVLLVSYYLVQEKNDNRRIREKYDHVITTIQEKITQDNLILCNGDLEKKITKIKLRSISNLLEYLQEVKSTSIKKSVDNIISDMDMFNELIMDHIDNPEYIEESMATIIRYKYTIYDKLVKLHLEVEKI